MNRLKNMTLRSILLFSLVGVVLVGGTLATLFATTNEVVNTFETRVHATGIRETVETTATGVSKVVQVMNETSNPAYVRVRFEVTPSDANVTIAPAGDGWSSEQTDGFYYYTSTLAGSEDIKNNPSLTSEITTNITIGTDADGETSTEPFDVIVYSESCYAEDETAGQTVIIETFQKISGGARYESGSN